MAKVALIQLTMACCGQVIVLASADEIYFTEFVAVGVRQTIIDMVYREVIEIIEGPGYAALVDGEVPDDVKFKKLRVTSSGTRCSMYCDAIEDLTGRLTRQQRATIRARPLGGQPPSESQ